MSKWYQMETNEVEKQLSTSPGGLNSKDIEILTEKYGKNELTDKKGKSTFVLFLEQFKDFLVIILIAAAAVSAVLGDIESAAVIIAVITGNAILGTVQQKKAESSLNSLKEMSTPETKVIRDGRLSVISSRDVLPGDIAVIEAGDFICADGRLFESASLQINESALTGESVSVEKNTSVIKTEAGIGDRLNMVHSGSFVTYGRGKFIVTETGMNTEVGKIALLLNNAKEKQTPLQVSLDRFGKRLAIGIIIICALLFALSVYQGSSIINAFMFSVALAVAAIPEALSSIVTIVLAFSTQKMANENAIIRKLQAVEGLGSVSIICSDKTGTLTQNKMTVMNYYIGGKVFSADIPDKDSSFERLVNACCLCNDSSIKDNREIGDPTETALISFASKAGFDYEDIRKEYPRTGEVPFDSDRKLMSVAVKAKDGLYIITKGAVDVVCGRVEKILYNNSERNITPDDISEILEANNKFSSNGLRVLAYAVKKAPDRFDAAKIGVNDENGLTFIGLTAMMDPPREESKAAVEMCKKAGIRPVMITGDHKVTATAIAKQIGIYDEGLLSLDGSEIESLTDSELEDTVEKVAVYARVSPEHKIRIVRAWQNKNRIVSMTGDGVNDAPALKQADIGVAMGITGTEVAKDAASMVLTDDNFATIVKAVSNGRNVYANIKKSIKFLLSGNTAGILAVLYASVAALPVPFEPVHLLFINLLTDSLPAIALGLDPHSDNVMNDKPRPKDEGIMTKNFVTGILTEGIVIGINTVIAFYIGLGSGSHTASTMAFSVLCLSRLFHGFNSKSERPVLFKKEMFNNTYLNCSFLIGFVLLNAVILIPFLQPVFRTVNIGLANLMAVYLLSFMNIPEIQLIKLIRTRIAK
ncbi:calcium-translocating P-type ATPase, PMCA-type [Lachnospiraceae bacterium NSJ-143]|nr:calcium-translocating P-type ATPase, PMCA-type [Lachnospiraceae bacterium NSJ-143]